MQHLLGLGISLCIAAISSVAKSIRAVRIPANRVSPLSFPPYIPSMTQPPAIRRAIHENAIDDPRKQKQLATTAWQEARLARGLGGIIASPGLLETPSSKHRKQFGSIIEPRAQHRIKRATHRFQLIVERVSLNASASALSKHAG